jgi:hypothetical protein
VVIFPHPLQIFIAGIGVLLSGGDSAAGAG